MTNGTTQPANTPATDKPEPKRITVDDLLNFADAVQDKTGLTLIDVLAAAVKDRTGESVTLPPPAEEAADAAATPAAQASGAGSQATIGTAGSSSAVSATPPY